MMKFYVFGYEVENKYIDLVIKDVYGDWYYFERFKLYFFKIEVSLSLFFICVVKFWICIFYCLWW